MSQDPPTHPPTQMKGHQGKAKPNTHIPTYLTGLTPRNTHPPTPQENRRVESYKKELRTHKPYKHKAAYNPKPLNPCREGRLRAAAYKLINNTLFFFERERRGRL